MTLVTPVVFLIFNRPQITRRVFDAIAKVRPKKLLVVCDGPRLDREGERELAAASRTVIEHVDWDCVKHTSCNLGSKSNSRISRKAQVRGETTICPASGTAYMRMHNEPALSDRGAVS